MKLRESPGSRWAGLSPSDRRAARRRLLVRTGFELFGDGGEAAVTVRSVCRTAELNSRYFYESFTDIDGFFGALYDEVLVELGAVLTAAMVKFPDANRARLRAGIRVILEFTAADRRRGRVLFAGAGTNPVFAIRRAAATAALRRMILADLRRVDPQSDPMSREVQAAIFVGALSEMAREWTLGALGDDLDLVLDAAMRILTPKPIRR